ncbi:RuBisCO chaperone RbcX [Dactylococcopsis salina]|uniref:RuBisCO chaperone RbcX n=1 Tax=Dactylococcopsis salina (strain PCC 8305) TaxID=13035 RepID=K9YU57_DACS8|nr:chaperonin family protein RbcX [Dactylococcopsis salina]AFZ50429.1 RbcX protein [Dactylococcopsis salina PCC 8305]
MNSKRVAQETAKVLQDYLTYQAVRTILDQLSETNPTQALWLRQFSQQHSLQNSEAYLEALMAERKDLVMRIMTVREDLAERVLDFLPEMVRSGMEESNLYYRCQILERLTQTPPEDQENQESDDSNATE